MSAPRRERISGVDTAWLRMDLPTNLMVIVGVMMFEGRLDVKRVKRTLENRFLAFRRFRQKAVQDPTGAWWEDDEDFDIDSHVHQVALPGKAGKAELQAFVSDLASTPLDASKPLWQFHLVDNYDGGSALVMRIHHCYADGIAMVAGDALDDRGHARRRASRCRPSASRPPGGGEADFWEQILQAGHRRARGRDARRPQPPRPGQGARGQSRRSRRRRSRAPRARAWTSPGSWPASR